MNILFTQRFSTLVPREIPQLKLLAGGDIFSVDKVILVSPFPPNEQDYPEADYYRIPEVFSEECPDWIDIQEISIEAFIALGSSNPNRKWVDLDEKEKLKVDPLIEE